MKKKLFQIEKSMEENRCKKSKRNSIIFCWMIFLLLFFPAVTLVIDSNLITECAVHWSLLTITNFYKFYWKINFIEKKKIRLKNRKFNYSFFSRKCSEKEMKILNLFTKLNLCKNDVYYACLRANKQTNSFTYINCMCTFHLCIKW